MVEAAQIEQRLAFEPRTARVEPVGRNESVARESNKPDFFGGPTARQGATDEREAAYSVEISSEAQQLAASGPGARTQPARQDLDATVETSATASIGSNAGDDTETNQVTSFVGERTGNDTRNETEAGRTLGQVIDTFA